ncbi:hypothetical protein J1605_020545 [Eschrichtius robustus]|uniref:Uncharacterized protein n=1 Tax=Eschrichtius robustus TaxID=9764 RepID=A0AB34HHS4_ESCRO|nr:hypothetical protein J1605_020545 [Eschrichtius robustus]
MRCASGCRPPSLTPSGRRASCCAPRHVTLAFPELAPRVDRRSALLDEHLAAEAARELGPALKCSFQLGIADTSERQQSEPEGFAHFHLYVCAAFLVRWRKEILEERDFQLPCLSDALRTLRHPLRAVGSYPALPQRLGAFHLGHQETVDGKGLCPGQQSPAPSLPRPEEPVEGCPGLCSVAAPPDVAASLVALEDVKTSPLPLALVKPESKTLQTERRRVEQPQEETHLLGWIPVHDLQAPSQLASPSPGLALHSAGHPKCTSPQTSGIFVKEPTDKAIKRISGASLIYKDRKKDNKMQSLIFEETEPGLACRRGAKRPHRSPALAHYVSSGLDAGTRCAQPLAAAPWNSFALPEASM